MALFAAPTEALVENGDVSGYLHNHGLLRQRMLEAAHNPILVASLQPLTDRTGMVMRRLVFSAVILLLTARPSLRGHSRSAWTGVVWFGLVLALMNGLFYLALERFGYDVTDGHKAVEAFQRRWRPEKIDGQIDGQVRAILIQLLLDRDQGRPR